MSKYFIASDERMIGLTGKLANIALSLTQLALLGAILYRRYVLGQGEENYNDIQVILGLSLSGYIAARLYFGAVLPVMSFKKTLRIYFVSVAVLFIILSFMYGLPSYDEWNNTILPVVLGPAIILGLYWGFAYFGKRRSEKDLG